MNVRKTTLLVVSGLLAWFAADAFAQIVGPPAKPQTKPDPARPRLATPQPKPQPSPLDPRLELSTTEWNFGTVWLGQKVQTEIKLTNAGLSPLKIISIRPSCGCTPVRKPKDTLEPGESDLLVVGYNTNKGAGPVNKSVTIQTNDPQTPSVRLMVRGVVKSVFETRPTKNMLVFGPLTRESRTTKTLELHNNYDKPLVPKLKGLQLNKQIEARLEEIEPGAVYKLTVTTKPPLRDGTLRAKLVIETGLEAAPEMPITVSGIVRPRVSVTPPTLFVPKTLKRATERPLRLTYQVDKPVKITDIKSSHTSVSARLLPPRPVAPNARMTFATHELRVSLPPGDQIPDEGVTLEIYTDDPDPQYAKLTVKISTKSPYRQRASITQPVVSPSRLYIPAGYARPSTRRVALRYPRNLALKIVEIKTSHESIQAKAIPVSAALNRLPFGVQYIQVSLPAGKDIPAEGATLEILTDSKDPKYAKLIVPITNRPVRRPAAPVSTAAPSKPAPTKP